MAESVLGSSEESCHNICLGLVITYLLSLHAMLRLCLNSIVLWFATTGLTNGSEQPLQFETHVRPILKRHCFQCHGEEEPPKGELDLRLVRLMLQGGETGAVIVPGNPEDSLLVQRLRDGEMPPDESKLLSVEEIQTIRDWITAGAQTVRPEPDILSGVSNITDEERSHWAFRPIVRPHVPSVVNSDSVSNAIDAFLLSRLETRGFSFSSRAKSETLLRRVYFDLHGVPPTPEMVSEFVARNDAGGWQSVVDKLLSSQHYGERWARHWLDVAGYADSEGCNDADAVRPYAWRYRDYVIRSFNLDKPFDEFICEQLAGDELVTSPLNNLSKTDAGLLVATGFLRMAPDGTGGAVPDLRVARNDTIADTIRIVSSSLMGITLECAQCHDHRYDPVSQVDYYRFRAVFEPAFDCENWRSPAQRQLSLYTDSDRAVAAAIETKAEEIDGKRIKRQTVLIEETFEKQLAKLPVDVHAAARAAHQLGPKERTVEQEMLFKKYPNLNVTAGSLYLYDQNASKQLRELANKATALRETKPREGFIRALAEVTGRIPVTKLFLRGDPEQPRQQVMPGGLTVVSETSEVLDIPASSAETRTSGRRLALAKRLTDPGYPLTARVIVNRVWLHHFGRGLVTTPADFGIFGQRPTHPELLDWLASELISSGWSLKHVHRLILTSTAWQQQLRTNDDQNQVDPDNELYGGSRLRRMDAEVIRDTLLAVSGKLNKRKFGTPVPVMPDRVGRFVIGRDNSNAGRQFDDLIDMKGEQFRRSIYIQVRRSRPLSMMAVFDRPSMSPNCDKRRPSTSSTQSLLMINSDQLIEYSRYLAERLECEVPGGLSDQVLLAWQLLYSRLPDDSEIEIATQFLKDQAAIFAAQPVYQLKEKAPKRTARQEALAVLCQMLFSSSEFLYVD